MRSRLRRTGILLIGLKVSVVIGCEGTSQPASPGSDAGAGAAGTAEVGGGGAGLDTCASKALCGLSVGLTCTYGSGCQNPPCIASFDPAMAKCVIQKLRDREVGVVGYSLSTDNAYCHRLASFVSFGDGTASVSRGDFIGQAGDVHYEPRRERLQPVAYFDQCLTLDDPQQLISCVEGATTGEVVAEPACPCIGDQNTPVQGCPIFTGSDGGWLPVWCGCD